MACGSGELTLTWDVPVPAENYTAIISRGMGQPLRCNSSVTRCIEGGLACGSSYSVVVFSVTGSCLSLPSEEVTVQSCKSGCSEGRPSGRAQEAFLGTPSRLFLFDLSPPVPCPPTGVSAVHTCAPHPVPVSWVASDSATHYTALAVSGTGHTSECRSNTTSCNLAGLKCGEVYTVGVSGVDDNCTGLLSDTVSLHTGKAALTKEVFNSLCYSIISKSQSKSKKMC